MNVIDKDNPRQGYNKALSFTANECIIYKEFHVSVKENDWHPFRIVKDDGGKSHYEIVPDDSTLVMIRRNWGETICNLLSRLETYNPSGRFCVRLPWDFENDKVVENAEVINQIKSAKLSADDAYSELLRTSGGLCGMEDDMQED